MQKYFVPTTIIIILATCLCSIAQERDILSIISNLNEPQITGEVIYKQEQTAGSQFIFDNWAYGSITFTNGSLAHNKLLNYNGYIDELILFNPTTLKTILVEKSSIAEFLLTDSKTGEQILFRQINIGASNQKAQNIFVQILAEGKYTLMAYRQVISRGKETFSKNDKLIEVQRIRPRTTYFIKDSIGNVIAIKPRRKSILKMLKPEDAFESRRIMDQYNLKINREADLVKLFQLIQ
jgi:hypothetical protein